MTRRIVIGTRAVAAGLVTIVGLSNGTDIVLEATGVFPPVDVQAREGFTSGWMVALAFTYRTIYLITGAYVTAALAARRPGRHALVLGVIGTALGILGAVATWGVTPAWFSVLLILQGLPCVWLGQRLRSRARRRSSSSRTRRSERGPELRDRWPCLAASRGRVSAGVGQQRLQPRDGLDEPVREHVHLVGDDPRGRQEQVEPVGQQRVPDPDAMGARRAEAPVLHVR